MTEQEDDIQIEESYWLTSRRPLEMLVFLVPFILLYEICLVFVLRNDQGTITNRAHEWLVRYFDFAIPEEVGLSFPSLVIVVVLLLWHVLGRHSWRPAWGTVGLMVIESALLAIPLVVLSRFVHELLPMVGQNEPILGSLGPMGLIAISIGAGLYEELLFRMLLFFLVHTLVVDLLRFSSLIGTLLAIVLSAVLFALYHPPAGPEATYTTARAFFYISAGLFFGVVYVFRGFGIVVAVHAFYDLVTLFAPD